MDIKKLSTVAAFIGILLLTGAYLYQKNVEKDVFFWITIIIGISPILFLLAGLSSACPKCHEWWEREKISDIGIRNWQERKKENNQYYWYNCEERLLEFHCKKCSHEWQETRVIKTKA